MIKASTLQSADSAQFRIRFIPNSSKTVFSAYLFGSHFKRYSVEKDPASFFVVPLDKVVKGKPPSLCGREEMGSSSVPVEEAHN